MNKEYCAINKRQILNGDVSHNKLNTYRKQRSIIKIWISLNAKFVNKLHQKQVIKYLSY